MKPEEPPLPLKEESSATDEQNQSLGIAPLFEDEQLASGMASLSCSGEDNPDLEMFREQWKNEIESKDVHKEVREPAKSNVEDQARSLFLQGVECEKRGDMSEAVHKYTRAMKLVPDIERRVHPQVPVAPRARSSSRARVPEDVENNLAFIFQQRIAQRGELFLPISEGSCHLGRLPVEILHLIVRYVVSSEMNLRQLETLSEVSTMMYLLSRDDDLWRNIHLRSFGEPDAVRQPVEAPELSWRELYLSSPHLQFDGVYLSKITYIRHGETGFQDSNYRPWHTVTYFRLMRFFADGNVLMTTSSESPQNCTALLKSRIPPKSDTTVSTGTWYQDGDEVVMMVRREYAPPPKPKYSRYNKRAPSVDYGVQRHEFAIRLRLSPLRVAGKWSLHWLENLCTVTYLDGRKNTTDLEADKNHQDFPALRFYRVKTFSDVPGGRF